MEMPPERERGLENKSTRAGGPYRLVAQGYKTLRKVQVLRSTEIQVGVYINNDGHVLLHYFHFRLIHSVNRHSLIHPFIHLSNTYYIHQPLCQALMIQGEQRDSLNFHRDFISMVRNMSTR